MGCSASTLPHPAAPFDEDEKLVIDDSLSLIGNAPSLVARGAGVTHIGYGPLKKENQDSFIIQDHFGSKTQSLFAVWDGHGNNGKTVSHFCKESIPALLLAALNEHNSIVNGEKAEEKRANVKEMIINSFTNTHVELCNSSVDCSLSGSTAALVFIQDQQVYIATAGDSRVVLGTQHPQNPSKIIARPLSIDHRPGRPVERARVLAAGARVQSRRTMQGHMVGQERLWLPDLDTPGLMVTRSLGDLVAGQVGCTAEPEVVCKVLTIARGHKYIVLASDGVWDVLSNQAVMEIVNEADTPQAGCKAVLHAALGEWEEMCLADNVSVVVVRLYSDSEAVPHPRIDISPFV